MTRVDRLPVGGADEIALLQPGLLRGQARRDIAQLNIAARGPAGGAHPGALVEHRRNGHFDALAVALYRHLQVAVGAGDFLQVDVFPVGVDLVVQLDDAVAFADARLGRRRIRHHVANDGLEVRFGNLLVLDHEEPGQQAHGQHDIHEGPGEGDDQPLPARLGEERAGIVGILFARLLAGHLDVTAEQDQREPVIRFAPAEAEQPRPEAEAERVHPHVEISRRPKVAQLVDQDHDPDQNQQPENVFENQHNIQGAAPRTIPRRPAHR